MYAKETFNRVRMNPDTESKYREAVEAALGDRVFLWREEDRKLMARFTKERRKINEHFFKVISYIKNELVMVR